MTRSIFYRQVESKIQRHVCDFWSECEKECSGQKWDMDWSALKDD